MHVDWTINPGYVVTWAILLLTLVWKLGAFVSRLEDLIKRFSRHEETDEAHFERIDDRLTSIEQRIEVGARGNWRP